jgi:CheY-like chemotaxis protein
MREVKGDHKEGRRTVGVSRRPVAERYPKPPYRRSSRDVVVKRPRAKKAGRLAKSLQEKRELILVVDDEAVIRQVMKMILEGVNYRVVCADDGREAMAIFAQQMGAIEAVITDVNMPSMDGVALIRAIARMKPDITFIAVTGGDESARISELESLGVKNFLMKPYNIDKLLNILGDALGGPIERPG